MAPDFVTKKLYVSRAMGLVERRLGMGRKWTEEDKAASRERALARYAAKKAAAATATIAVEEEPEVMRPDGTPVRDDDVTSLSQKELFIARMKAQKPITTVDDLAKINGADADILEPNSGSNVEHRSAGLVWMYKREVWGWRRLKVSRNSVAELIGAGFLDRCGSCGSTRCPGTINGCASGKKRMYRMCPVAGCNEGRGKHIYDLDDPNKTDKPSNDPFAIQDSFYSNSTPALRTKAALDAHIRAFHETEAIARGLMNIQQVPVR